MKDGEANRVEYPEVTEDDIRVLRGGLATAEQAAAFDQDLSGGGDPPTTVEQCALSRGIFRVLLRLPPRKAATLYLALFQ